uniref:Uncharacterized protein n=1 Tax=Solanum lycopersicum TaxID=4081 RepID=A0A3Q7GI14_SOLLC
MQTMNQIVSELKDFVKKLLIAGKETKSNWITIKRALWLVVESGFSSSPLLDSLNGSLHNSDKVVDGRRSLVLVVFIGGDICRDLSSSLPKRPCQSTKT